MYLECPLKFRLKFIDKLPEPSSPALERGDKIHKQAEAYINGKLPPAIPAELNAFTKEFKALRKLQADKPKLIDHEVTWAHRADWSPTTWNDWDGCWLRIKVDVAVFEPKKKVVTVTDFKTGKFRPEQEQAYLQQLELYSLGALLRWPEAVEVRPELLYLDLGQRHAPLDAVKTRADLEPLKKTWTTRVRPMFADKTWAPRPGSGCRWCFFRKDNGGPCKF